MIFFSANARMVFIYKSEILFQPPGKAQVHHLGGVCQINSSYTKLHKIQNHRKSR